MSVNIKNTKKKPVNQPVFLLYSGSYPVIMRKILPTSKQLEDGIGYSVLFFFFSMTWICFGIILFGVLFQWILLAFLPKDWYPYAMSGFILAWYIFGFWMWLIGKRGDND
ncbi:MAG TPA: hypothetical protein DCY95_16640 [Algoriphagus sp.]|nr:hypothetical protein [Algoriphagus sp.]HAH36912.1 hypothetical protein [Algoriphagus sp.]HAZ26001.1 hypothetical protein [Algoriphagus sp.]HCB45433.1 hypothetical protein [Algoriphagus sp.]